MMIAAMIITEPRGTIRIIQGKSICRLTGQFENLQVRPAMSGKVKILQVSFKENTVI